MIITISRITQIVDSKRSVPHDNQNNMLREGTESRYHLPDRHWSQGKKLPK